MGDYYEPELGQIAFGQPYKDYRASNDLVAALRAIDTRLCMAMRKINRKEYNSPFSNSGNDFKCDTFQVEAYSWDDDIEQPWNFKWRDVEVSWYKYLGRGMSVNQPLSNDRIAEMLDDCLRAIWEMEGGF